MSEKSVESHSSLIVGIVYNIFPLLLLVVYLIFNVILHQKDEFRKLVAFRLMFYIGVLDCVQLICHSFSGILTIWPSISTHLPILNQVTGATLNSAWVGLFPLSFVTALYRLITIRKVVHQGTTFPLMVKGGVVIAFVYCFSFWTCLISLAGITYDPDSWAWSYTDGKVSYIMSKLEYIVSIGCIVSTFVIYIAIAATIYKIKRETTTPRITSLRLIISAATSFLVLTSLLTFWHYYYLFLPDSVWTVFAINLYWITYCGLNPFLYMVCLKRIRRSFFQFIHLASPKASTVTVIRDIKRRPIEHLDVSAE